MILFILSLIALSQQSPSVTLTYLTAPQTDTFSVGMTISGLSTSSSTCGHDISCSSNQQMVFGSIIVGQTSLKTVVIDRFGGSSLHLTNQYCNQQVVIFAQDIRFTQAPLITSMSVTIDALPIFQLPGIDPTTLSVNPTFTVDSLEAFATTNLYVQFVPYFSMGVGTTFTLTFPDMNSNQLNGPSFITSSLSCSGITGFETTLQCSFQNNVLTISGGFTTPYPKNTPNLKFKVSGFRNSFIVQDISITLNTYYQGQLCVGPSTNILSINSYHQGSYSILGSNTVVNQVNSLTFNLTIDSYLETNFVVQILFPFQINTNLQFTCVSSCQGLSNPINYVSTQEIQLSLQNPIAFCNQPLIFKLTNFMNPHKIGIQELDITIFDNYNDQLYVISTGIASIVITAQQIDNLQLQLSNNILQSQAQYTFTFSTPFVIQPTSIVSIVIPPQISSTFSSGFIPNIGLDVFYFFNGKSMQIYNYFKLFQNQQQFTITLNNVNNPLSTSFLSGFQIFISYDNSIILQSNIISQSYIAAQITILEGSLAIPDKFYNTVLELSLKFGQQLQTNEILQIKVGIAIIQSSTICQIQYRQVPCQTNNNQISVTTQQVDQTILLQIQNLSYPRTNEPMSVFVFTTIEGQILQQSISNYLVQVDYIRPFQNDTLSCVNNFQQIRFMVPLDILIGETLILRLYDNIINTNTYSIQSNSFNYTAQVQASQIQLTLSKQLIKSQTYDLNFSCSCKVGTQSILMQGIDQKQFTIASSLLSVTQSAIGASNVAKFLIFQINPQQYYFYQKTDYLLSFYNQVQIPANGYLFLSLSQVSKQVYCSNIQCIPYQNGIKIVFLSQLESSQHSITISNIENPSYSNSTVPLSYQLSSFDEFSNMLENGYYYATQQLLCGLNCLVCGQQSDASTQCIQCNPRYQLFMNKCISDCPSGYVSQDNQCVQCHTEATCLSCSQQDLYYCIDCAVNYTQIFGQCIKNVPQNKPEQNLKQNVKQSQFPQDGYLTLLTLLIALILLIYKIFRNNISYFKLFVSITQLYELIADISICLILAMDNSNLFYVSLTQLAIRLVQLIIIKQHIGNSFSMFNIIGIKYRFLKFITIYYSWKTVLIFSSSITKDLIFNMQIKYEHLLYIDSAQRHVLFICLAYTYNSLSDTQLDYFYFSLISLAHHIGICLIIKKKDQRLLKLPK